MTSSLQARDFKTWVSVVKEYVPPTVEVDGKTVPKDIAVYTDVETLAAKQNYDGLNAIIHAVTPDLFHHMATCQTSHEAWNRLRNVFEGNTTEKEARLQNLMPDWENLRMLEDDTFEEFNYKLSEIVNACHTYGKTIPERDIVSRHFDGERGERSNP